MADLIKKIRTDAGDLQIDYNALANLPQNMASQEYVNTSIASFSNPNLLINSDFRNPVNQRGLTEYATSPDWKYSIDRWKFIGALSVKPSNGVLTLTNSENTSWFMQAFERVLPEDSYTLTVKVRSVTGTCNIYFENSSGAQTKTAINNTGLITLSYNGPISAVTFEFIGEGSVLQLEWVKLEHGTVATPFVPKNYYEEMAICTKYYRAFKSVVGTVSVLDTTYAFLPIELGGMRTSPTVGYTEGTMKINVKGKDYVVSSITSNRNSTGGVVLLSLGITGLTSDCVGCAGIALMNNEGISDVSLYNKLTLDAEIY